MTPTRILIGSIAAASLSAAAWAKPVDDLVAKGFVVLRSTSVTGDFAGCERELKVQLDDGAVFTCSGFGYMHAHNPKVVVLKSKDGRYKLVVQDAVFDGVLG